MNLPTLHKPRLDYTLSSVLSVQCRCSPWESMSNCEIISALSDGRLQVVEGTVIYEGERKPHVWLVDSEKPVPDVIDPTYATSPWKTMPTDYIPNSLDQGGRPRAVRQLSDFTQVGIRSLVYRLTGSHRPLVDL